MSPSRRPTQRGPSRSAAAPTGEARGGWTPSRRLPAGARAGGLPQALGTRLAFPSGPCGWHWVKAQRFQEPKPHFGEARDKVISPRTHRGRVPAVPPFQRLEGASLPEFQANGDSAKEENRSCPQP